MIKQISCGIVIYDEVSDIKRLLPQLQLELLDYDVNWVFVLNHEQAEIRRWIKNWLFENIKNATCLENPSNNLGYARQLILENSLHSYIYMTDPDIEIVPNSLIKLIHLAETETFLDRKLKIIGFSGTVIHKSNISFLQDTYDFIYSIAKKIPFSFQIQHHSHLESVDHVPSCHLLLKKDKAIEIGGFSHLFAQVGEDLDFSHRAFNEGYRFIFLPTSPAYHFQNISITKWLYKVFLFGKIQISVQKKNYKKGLRYYRLLPLALLLFTFIFAGFFSQIFLGLILCALTFGLYNTAFFGFILTLVSYSAGELFEIVYPTLELQNAEKLLALKETLSEKVLKSNI